jgi:hypothetical protein
MGHFWPFSGPFLVFFSLFLLFTVFLLWRLIMQAAGRVNASWITSWRTSKSPSKMLTAALFLAGLGLLSLPTIGSAYTVRGMPDCQEWKADQTDRFWAMGYISGRNAALDESLTSGKDMDEVYQFVTQFCQANPDKDADDALQAYAQAQGSSSAASAAPASPAAAPARAAAASSGGYEKISMLDLKLDIDRMRGDKIETRTSLISFGGMLMMTDPNQAFDGNGILADQDKMSREDRAFVLQQCASGCVVTVQGEVKEIMFQSGVLLHRLIR